MTAALNLALLEKTRDAVNGDREFRRLGTCDARMGLKIGDAAFLVDFAAFGCAAVASIELDALRDADFYLEQSPAQWRSYLDGRRAGVAPTLISLDVATPDGLVKGSDPLKTLKFERFHLTLQAFVDAGAQLAS